MIKVKRELQKFIKDLKKENLPGDLHVTRMCSSFIAVSNGKVIKLTEPKMKYCPLIDSLYDFPKTTDRALLKAKIREAIEWKISKFGLFTDLRQLQRNTIAIPFGASEMIMYDLKIGRGEAALVVCDGAGTVITDNPQLVQGIGARMNGVFYTSPIDKVINGIIKKGGEVPFPDTAKIDQTKGLEKALVKYKSIDITVSGLGEDSLKEIRKIEAKHGASVTILVVCTTGIEEERVREVKAHADLVWSCASGKVRDIIGREAKLQIATKIPVYALTQKSLDFISSYSTNVLSEYLSRREGPFIISGRCKHLPSVNDYQRITMGNFKTYIGRVEKLPIRSGSEPKPLL